MTKITLLALILIISQPAFALRVFNLNVFDQLQGQWPKDFRDQRLKALQTYVKENPADIIVFQESRNQEQGSEVAFEAQFFNKPFQNYISEMLGADGFHYGYWMGSDLPLQYWLQDGFEFPGGVKRKVQAGIFSRKGKCLGIISLHLSYQSSEVRQQEANWLLAWLKREEKECPQWLVLGDFNADSEDAEMQILFQGGLKNLLKEKKPTVGAFNPIRRIYGDNIPSRTIDWALGWNLDGAAKVVLDQAWNGVWVSDHAGLQIDLNSF